jgi:hypothetical protein
MFTARFGHEEIFPNALREILQNIAQVCMNFRVGGLMQEETENILYQRTQNGWNRQFTHQSFCQFI